MITIEPPSKLSNSAVATLSPSGLTRFLNRARAAVNLDGEVDVLLTSDAALRRLNRDFRGKDKPTDVLSFPSPEEIASEHAGDLAISLETAARQAASFGHSLRDEVRVLMLHGLLHLSGMDHETDNGEMAAREVELRSELRLSTTLIERVSPIEFVGGPKQNAGVPRIRALHSARNDETKGLRSKKEKKKRVQRRDA
jgi:probable rRNA maturation factor